MRYLFIVAHADEWPVTAQCRVLELTTSGFYSWKKRPNARRHVVDDRLSEMIRRIFSQHRGNYGSPRITKELRALGHRVNEKRIERLMREMGLQAKQKRKFRPQTTVVDENAPVSPDLLEQDFTAEGANQRWVGDITYLETSDGFEYLATVIDLYSRRVVGWALAPTLETTIVMEAMDMALRQRRPPAGLIFHSDRGCQYTSQAFRDRLRLAEIRQSMSRSGCCYDNAAAESFFHSLKVEWIHGQEIRNRETIRTEVFRYIEGYYNRCRRHSSIGYLSPAEFERGAEAVA
jgi:transposase InsO family protein